MKPRDQSPPVSIPAQIVGMAFPAVVTVVLLAAVAVAGFAFYYLRSVQVDSFEEQVGSLGELLVAAAESDHPQPLEGVLQRWGEMRDLRVAAVYGRNGEPLAVLRRPSAGDTALPTEAPLPSERHVGLDSLRVARLIEGRKGFSGILYVDVAFGTLYRYLFILLGSLAVLTLLAIVAMRAALAKAEEWLARPIADLAALASELSGRPDLDKRASLTGPQEIADLARTFNDMLDSLQQKTAHLDNELRERARTEKLLDHLAHYDSVTGLANRVYFHKELPRAAERARRLKSNIALVYLDLDDFKVVNDTLGHQVGDQLLHAVGVRFATLVRKGDLVCRLGGDEFTVILENIRALRDAVEVVTKLIDKLAEPYPLGEHTLHIGVSAGIALFPEQTVDLADLLRFADIAMYQAKAAGKNDYCIYTSDLLDHANRRLALESDLRRGIEQEEFFLMYQPQVEILSGKIVGLEALVRWQHPERGVLPPGHFIQVAEDSGLIVALGRQIMNRACQDWAVWRDAGLDPPRLAINVSGRQLDEEGFVDDLVAALATAGRPRPRLELEITESLILNEKRISKSMLHRLAGAGIEWSLDDFGTGYSSLTYLTSFPSPTSRSTAASSIAFPATPIRKPSYGPSWAWPAAWAWKWSSKASRPPVRPRPWWPWADGSARATFSTVPWCGSRCRRFSRTVRSPENWCWTRRIRRSERRFRRQALSASGATAPGRPPSRLPWRRTWRGRPLRAAFAAPCHPGDSGRSRCSPRRGFHCRR